MRNAIPKSTWLGMRRRWAAGGLILVTAAMALCSSAPSWAQSPSAASRSLEAQAPAAAAETAAAAGQPPALREHPLIPAIKLARNSRQALEAVADYEAVFIKRERINGELTTQTMQLKVREAPFSVYLKNQDYSPGREILYVKGQNNGQLLAHEGTGVRAFIGTVHLALDDQQVLAENRHLITDFGLRRMVDLVLAQWEVESKYAEVKVQYYPEAKIGGVLCPAIECSHPVPRTQYPYHVTRLYIDSTSNLPVRIENYGYPPQPGQEAPLIEEYTYVKIRPNIGLTDADFSAANANYRF